MKKLLFLVFFLPLVSYGQLSKGTKFVGGDMVYSAHTVNYGYSSEPTSTMFSLNGQVGYFLSDSWAVGPMVNYITNNRPNINPVTNLFEDIRVTGIAGGLFARKFFTISDNFLFSLEGKGLAGNINRGVNRDIYNESSTRVYLSLRPAFTFMPNPKWGFDASIGEIFYQSNWTDYYLETTNFRISFGHVNLGVNYFFGR
ncbi:outer membrane beta-barrel protein [Litoribacter populi]|uniref:outer membrane beta-barrel protein n=1 Tax=Litoribacter populi TaxID=2598460 RepID=UPI00117D4924|nr:outer membrane beta-barrel protein [Litoribacter populi]